MLTPNLFSHNKQYYIHTCNEYLFLYIILIILILLEGLDY
jgi:hypothetical protein